MEAADIVVFECPECCQKIELDAKAVDHIPGPYTEESVPKIVADAILNSVVYCPHCGDRFKVMIDTHAHTVPLFLCKN